MVFSPMFVLNSSFGNNTLPLIKCQRNFNVVLKAEFPIELSGSSLNLYIMDGKIRFSEWGTTSFGEKFNNIQGLIDAEAMVLLRHIQLFSKIVFDIFLHGLIG